MLVIPGTEGLVSQQGISNAFGAASIIFWLFAQLPQVFVNWRSSSVDGLALPFLINWLAGDVTNLVGAVLTDQLEFQKLLAAWFTVIDITLVLQYFYYTTWGRQPTAATARKHDHSSHSHPHPRPAAVMSASFATERSASPGTLKRLALSRTESTSSYHQQQSKRRKHQQWQPSRPSSAGPSSRNHSRTSTMSETAYPDIPEEETLLTDHMRDSFQSERSKRSTSTIGESQRRGRNWSRMAQSAPLPPLRAGEVGTSGTTTPTMRQTSLSRERDRPIVTRGSRTSQSRSRSVMFLSVWGFAGFVRYAGMSGASSMLGGLSSRSDIVGEPAAQAWRASIPELSPTASQISQREVSSHIDVSYQAASSEDRLSKEPHVPPPATPDEPPLPPPSKERDMQRSIGRISAWIAVVFYLTSRMPQIWKNYQRRSVEGLSILLFIAAFHGNLCYVLSVLSSPLVETEEGYLFESVPFLLGSGGTLVFDMMIMFQACIYRNRAPRTPKVHHHHHHSSSRHRDTEEVAGLLAHAEHSQSRSRSRPPAGRSRTTSGEWERQRHSVTWEEQGKTTATTGKRKALPEDMTPSVAEELPDIPFVRQVSEEWV